MPIKNIDNLNKAPENHKARTLSLIVTKNCNLKCSYCYEKEKLRSTKIMDLSIAKEKITYYMEKEDGYNQIIIDLFGGEPMLGFDFIRDIVTWFQSRNWKKCHTFMIGTNGTIFTDEMTDWLLKNKRHIVLALSLDGTKKAHDLTRDNSYDLVKKNLPFIKSNWPNQPAKMTISAETIPYVAESVIELEDMEMFFTANIGFEDLWGNDNEKAILLKEYERQLMQLVDYYAARPNLYPVSPLMTAVPEYLGIPKSIKKKENQTARFCGAGHEMVVVDIDGSTYPCHRFLPWVTGIPSPGATANCQSAWKPEKCSNCKLLLSCPTCAGYNWEVHRDTGIRTTFHCEAYKIEVMASSRLEAIKLSRLLKDGFKSMPVDQQGQIKRRLEAVYDLIENGI
ncbi:MAG: radical SAM protein [bacterium]|nr:radical SAM protein [bacterium]